MISKVAFLFGVILIFLSGVPADQDVTKRDVIDDEILVRVKKVRDNADRIREFAEDSKEEVDERKYAYAEGIAEDTVKEIETIKGLLGADGSNDDKKEVKLDMSEKEMNMEEIHDTIEEMENEVENLKRFVEDASQDHKENKNEDQDALEEDLVTIDDEVQEDSDGRRRRRKDSINTQGDPQRRGSRRRRRRRRRRTVRG